MIEKAIFNNSIKKKIDEFDRVYYGNEFCENLIPNLSLLKNFYYKIKEQGKKFTFVAPYVTNKGITKLERIFEFLNNNLIEVVFNDWGVFNLMVNNFKNIRPVLGRLLTKQKRDPRLLRVFANNQNNFSKDKLIKNNTVIFYPKKVPGSLFKHCQSSLADSKIFQEYLISNGIQRVEIDNLAWKMSLNKNKKIGISLYLPYNYISTSRMCGKVNLTYNSCQKECKKYMIKIEDEKLGVPIYSIGNTVFYKSNWPERKYLERLGVDRIIYQPKLPF